MEPFKIAVPDQVLRDLRERLDRTRWPGQVEAYGWAQGTEPGYLRGLLEYWREGYDWRRHEAELNGFDQFMAGLSHGRMHFIHQRSPHPSAKPLLLLHGWPGSVYEFHKLIPRLTDPPAQGGNAAQAFHVVAPSLPGYGFSDAPREPGFSPRRMARAAHELMHDVLGYPRFLVQGGDWGAVICSWMGFDFPQAVAGIHLNMMGLRAAPGPDSPPLSEEEKAFLADAGKKMKEDMAYMAIQGTRPQSLGYGLNDSPVGLAGWLVEKFHAWTDCGGELERSISKDELLTNIMIYWVSGSITSSMRLYYEYRQSNESLPPGERVEVPTGFANFPGEIFNPPRSWVERNYNIQRWTDMPAGGHFAALEAPRALAEDMAAFFATIAIQD
ncbi:MAG: alpha/beta fold hydrolase [SAR324 cluster bacterium]|nr:alpha/beta fold hydrolase [SAR324 cluster bacterium]